MIKLFNFLKNDFSPFEFFKLIEEKKFSTIIFINTWEKETHLKQIAWETASDQYGVNIYHNKEIQFLKNNKLSNSIPFDLITAQRLIKLFQEKYIELTKDCINAIAKIPPIKDQERVQRENLNFQKIQKTIELLQNSIQNTNDPDIVYNYSLFIETNDQPKICMKIFNLEFINVILEDSFNVQVYDHFDGEQDKQLKIQESFKNIFQHTLNDIFKLNNEIQKMIFESKVMNS